MLDSQAKEYLSQNCHLTTVSLTTTVDSGGRKMVNTITYNNKDGEEYRAIYSPHSHTWYAHSLTHGFRVTRSSASLSEVMQLADKGIWLPLIDLAELSR